MESASDFDTVQRDLSAALIGTIRLSSSIAAEDPSYLRTLKSSINIALDDRTRKLLGMTERLVRRSRVGTAAQAPKLPDIDALEVVWKQLVETTDSLLERADIALDEYKGYFRQVETSLDTQLKSETNRPLRSAKAFRDVDMPKPQLQFTEALTNFATEPFKPLITTKPHALRSFQESIQLEQEEMSGHPQYIHPYEDEIHSYQFPAAQIQSVEPRKYKPFDTTTAIFVDTLELADEMLDTLSHASEIAVDLEHHDAHSYIGLVSLIQISTRDQDWIVDTLKPWRRRLERLNAVFTNPTITKVFHGSTMDINWLQRDLGIYVVGLFDTYHATCILSYPAHSLASLLKRFADVTAQKQYQMADWRIRPLPQELFDYARSDTHYLLYIFDCLRNELIDASPDGQSQFVEVIERSKAECLQRYEYPFYVDEPKSSRNGWFSQLHKAPSMENDAQLAVYVAVHRWRDQLARACDESLHTVMPLWTLSNLVGAMPSTEADVARSLQPVTKFVRPKLKDLTSAIQEAKLNPRHKLADVQKALANIRAKRRGPPLSVYAATKLHPVDLQFAAQDAIAEASLFWGDVAVISDTPLHANTEVVRVPNLSYWSSSPGFVDPCGGADETVKTPAIRTIEEHIPSERATISKKRKMASDTEPPPKRLDGAMEEPITAAHKKQINLKAKASTTQQMSPPATEVLDYAAAPSLLTSHASDEKKDKRHNKSTAKNPWAKTLNTTTSVKAKSMPRAGRSATFR